MEPCFWQRVYLLWTFRNFRQLSLPLLNPRQIALINNLFRQHAAVVSHEYEPSREIGVVENFVPPVIELGAALAIGATPAATTDAWPAVKAELPEQTAGQYVAPPVIPIAAAPAMKADVPPAVQWEEAEEDGTRIDRAEIAPRNALDRLFAPKASWLRFASSNLAASRPQVSRIVIFRFAAAIGALSLCAFFIVAFHRVGAVPGSHARSSPSQLNAPDSPSAPGPTSVAENPAPVPEVTPEAGAGPDAAVEAGIGEGSIVDQYDAPDDDTGTCISRRSCAYCVEVKRRVACCGVLEGSGVDIDSPIDLGASVPWRCGTFRTELFRFGQPTDARGQLCGSRS